MRYFFHTPCIFFVHFGSIADLQQVVSDVVELLGYFEPFCLGVDEGVLSSIGKVLVVILKRLVFVFYIFYEFYQLILLLLQL